MFTLTFNLDTRLERVEEIASWRELRKRLREVSIPADVRGHILQFAQWAIDTEFPLPLSFHTLMGATVHLHITG